MAAPQYTAEVIVDGKNVKLQVNTEDGSDVRTFITNIDKLAHATKVKDPTLAGFAINALTGSIAKHMKTATRSNLALHGSWPLIKDQLLRVCGGSVKFTRLLTPIHATDCLTLMSETTDVIYDVWDHIEMSGTICKSETCTACNATNEPGQICAKSLKLLRDLIAKHFITERLPEPLQSQVLQKMELTNSKEHLNDFKVNLLKLEKTYQNLDYSNTSNFGIHEVDQEVNYVKKPFKPIAGRTFNKVRPQSNNKNVKPQAYSEKAEVAFCKKCRQWGFHLFYECREQKAYGRGRVTKPAWNKISDKHFSDRRSHYKCTPYHSVNEVENEDQEGDEPEHDQDFH